MLGIYIFLAGLLYPLPSGFHGLLTVFFLATNCLHTWALLGFCFSWKETLLFLSHFCWRIYKTYKGMLYRSCYMNSLLGNFTKSTVSLQVFINRSINDMFGKKFWQIYSIIWLQSPFAMHVPAKLLMFQIYHCYLSEVLTKGNYDDTCVCNLWLKNSYFTNTFPRASLNVNTSIKRTAVKKNLTMTTFW